LPKSDVPAPPASRRPSGSQAAEKSREDMGVRADFIVLADAVAASDGYLDMHGAGWDSIIVRTIPHAVMMALGIRLRIP
jgi:hypothetical protein